MEIPTDLKYVTPYVQRGQELMTRDPVVSYYARYYAAKLAIARGPRTKGTNEYLSHLLDSLEQQKSAIGENEAITDDLVGYAHIENFALKIFINADNEDRDGKSSKKTAKTFLAASIFLELLKTFGDLDPEIEAKIKYSKWKAADIMKALREGRVPTPGPPGGFEKEQDEQEDTTMNDLPPPISEFPSPPSNFTAPLPPTSPHSKLNDIPPSPSTTTTTHDNNNTMPTVMPSRSNTTQPPPVAPVPAPAPAVQQVAVPQISVPEPATNNINVAAAQKNAKWAISALDYDDIKTARLQLLSALNEIGYSQENNFGY